MAWSLMDVITGKADQPKPWDRLTDAFTHAAVNSPLGGGGLARAWYKHKGYSDAQITAAMQATNQDYDKKYAKAPVFQHVRSGHPLDYVSPDNIGRGAVSLLGSLLGGVDPTYAVGGFGSSAVKRVASQAAVQGASSVGRQKVNVNTGMQDHIDPTQVVEDAGMGALFQGGHEALRGLAHLPKSIPDEHVIRPTGQRQSLVSPTSDVAPLAPDGLPGNGSVRPMDPKLIADIMGNPEGAGGAPLQRRTNARDLPPSFADEHIQHEAPPTEIAHDDIVAHDPASTPEGPLTSQGRQYKGFEEHATDDPDGNKFLTYTTQSGDKLPIKMGIEPDGTAEIAIDQFGNGKNKLGPAEIRGAMNDLMEMYPDIKRFGGYRRSGAGAGRVQEIEPNRPQSDLIDTLPPANQEFLRNQPDNVVGFPQNEATPQYDQMAQDHQNSTLTPAEAQEMDASAPKPIVDNTGYEAHTPNVEIPTAANDATRGEALKGLVPSILKDERGTLGYKDEKSQEEYSQDPTVQKLISALSEADPLSAKQKVLYNAEISKRVGQVAQVRQHTNGINGFYQELGQLKGQMPKVDFSAIADKFSPEEVDSLMDMIKNHPRLTIFDSINARSGLLQLLNGEIPAKGKLEVLKQVFPKEAMDAIAKKQPLKAAEIAANVLGVPRAIMSSFDFSAPFRQGIAMSGTKQFWTAFPDMFKSAFSEKHFNELQDSIASRPTYKLMRQHGLALTGTGGNLLNREEAFISNYAEKIPGLGRVIAASDRAYVGFLNKVRADSFDKFVKMSKEMGLEDDHTFLPSVTRFVNAATGRGNLGSLGQSTQLLANAFFSPRLMASRVQLLDPRFVYGGGFYGNLHPAVRQQAIKQMLTATAAVTTILGMAKAGGLQVDIDPRSTDFAKIRIGNTRLDITGGFAPYIRGFAQMIMGQTKNQDGKVTNVGYSPLQKFAPGVDQGPYKPTTRLDVAAKFFETKASPNAGAIMDALRGTDMVGNPLSVKGEATNLLTPLIVQDTYNAYQDLGAKGILTVVPNAFGVGVQTYTPKQKKAAGRKSNSEFGTGGGEFSSGGEKF